MASLGHEVIGIDVIPEQVEALSNGHAPFHEPDFPELLAGALATGRLRFSTDSALAADATVHFICVGTPQRKGENAADVSYVDAATTDILRVLKPGDLVVGKSTVPVGTATRLADQVAGFQPEAHLMWNPEFLREGHAVADTLEPDRLVYGVRPGDAHARPSMCSTMSTHRCSRRASPGRSPT